MSGGVLYNQVPRWKWLEPSEYGSGEPEYCRHCCDETPHFNRGGRLLCGDCQTDIRAPRKRDNSP